MFFTNKRRRYGPYGDATSSSGSYASNLACDLGKAIKMDHFPVGFSGAIVSFLFIFLKDNYVVKFH